jgi:NLI interacting factor-like phosphatase
MIKRPGIDALFEYLFTNHVIMVCTSVTGKNANFMVNKLLTAEQRKKLVTIRPRHTFGLTPAQYASKVQIYKNLEDIWNDPIVDNAVPHGQPAWSMANTVLIDDSVLKAKAQPHSLIQVPEFEWEMTTGKGSLQKVVKVREEQILKSVQEKLELLKQQANVTSLIRLWHEGEKVAPDVDEKVDQGRQAALNEDGKQAQLDGAENYPTPTSLEATPGQESEERYEPPEEVELVFRGRKQVAQNNKAAKARCEPAKQQVQRELSPVTEQDFDWLKK